MVWIDYVKWFVTKNDHIEEGMYGKWIAILANDPRQRRQIQVQREDNKMIPWNGGY